VRIPELPGLLVEGETPQTLWAKPLDICTKGSFSCKYFSVCYYLLGSSNGVMVMLAAGATEGSAMLRPEISAKTVPKPVVAKPVARMRTLVIVVP
jgi:hypothetical protein